MKKKNKKLVRNTSIFLGIILVLGILAYNFIPQNFGAGQIESQSLSFSDSGNYYTVNFVTDYTQSERNEFGSWNEISIPVNINSYKFYNDDSIPILPSDIQTDMYFPVSSVDWQLSASPNDNVLKSGMGTIQITEIENNVECKVEKSGTHIGTDQPNAKITCKGDVKYSFTPTAGAMQRNDLTIKVNILKEGIECLDNSWCQSGYECQSNNCIKIENPITYYRFSDNKCSEVSLLSSQVTSNDYTTLSLCSKKIEEETGEEVIIENKECEANVDCINVCGDKIPTCESNICYCDEKVYEQTKEKTNYYYLLIPIIILSLLIFIIYKLVKRK